MLHLLAFCEVDLGFHRPCSGYYYQNLMTMTDCGDYTPAVGSKLSCKKSVNLMDGQMFHNFT